MRVVLDSNVIVSAFIKPDTPPALLIATWRAGRFQLITSAPLLTELAAVLSRPKISKYTGFSAADRAVILAEITETAIVVAPAESLRVIDRDPSDDRLLEAAVAGHADFICSGDAHLGDLARFEGIEIVTPARLVAILGRSDA